MKKFLHHFRFATFGVAILCTLLGVALLLWPDQSMNVLGYGFGAVLTISGLLQIGGYVAGNRQGFLKKLMLLAGILIAVVGVAILLAPKTVMKLTVVVIGIVMLYHGVMDIKFGFDIKECNDSKWAVTLVMGLVTCALGVLVLVNPFESARFLMIIIGIGLIFDGLSDVVTVSVMAQAKRIFELTNQEPVIEIDAAVEEAEEEPLPENDESSDAE